MHEIPGLWRCSTNSPSSSEVYFQAECETLKSDKRPQISWSCSHHPKQSHSQTLQSPPILSCTVAVMQYQGIGCRWGNGREWESHFNVTRNRVDNVLLLIYVQLWQIYGQAQFHCTARQIIIDYLGFHFCCYPWTRRKLLSTDKEWDAIPCLRGMRSKRLLLGINYLQKEAPNSDLYPNPSPVAVREWAKARSKSPEWLVWWC